MQARCSWRITSRRCGVELGREGNHAGQKEWAVDFVSVGVLL